jgi:flagellar motility protein MotE (MotC chaperone)
MSPLRAPIILRMAACGVLIGGGLLLIQNDAQSQPPLSPIPAAPVLLAQAMPMPELGTSSLTAPGDAPHLEIRSMELRQWKDKLRERHAKPIDPTRPPKPYIDSDLVRRACGKVKNQEMFEREQRLAEARAALLEEMERVEMIQLQVKRKWRDTLEMRQAAEASQLEAEMVCSEWGTAALSRDNSASADGADPAKSADDKRLEERIEKVVRIMKTMKAKPAARILQGLDEELAATTLMRLPARVASKIVAAMPAPAAGRLTARLAPKDDE